MSAASLPAAYGDAALHCEQALLGAVMLRNSRYATCLAAGLKSQHFLSDLNARIWHEIGALLGRQQEANPVTLTPRLAGERDFEAAGGHRYLGRLATCTVDIGIGDIGIGDIASHAAAMLAWSSQRQLFQLSRDLDQAVLGGVLPLEEILDGAAAALDACRPPPADGGLRDFASLFDEALAANQRSFERGSVDGVPSGLQELDALLGGFAKSDLTVVAGRPGMGKSAFGLGVALHNARQGRCVLLFTLEMSAVQLANRAIAQGCGISADKLRNGSFDKALQPAIDQAAEALTPLPLFIDDSTALQPAEVKARARRVAAKRPLDLIVIDHVQLMRPPQRTENRVQELTGITGGLKGVAKSLAVPVLALSQLNRAPEQRDDKRPLLADLRESGSLEQDADQVVLLFREHYYAQREEPRETDTEAHHKWVQRMKRCAGQADLIVAKNRHGGVGIAKVGFDPVFTRFHDLTR